VLLHHLTPVSRFSPAAPALAALRASVDSADCATLPAHLASATADELLHALLSAPRRLLNCPKAAATAALQATISPAALVALRRFLLAVHLGDDEARAESDSEPFALPSSVGLV